MRDLLVTGTDTGIGKTVIAAALLRALRRRGVRAIGFKPAETGLAGEELADSERLARAAQEQLPLAAPLLRLREPLAPAVAADRAGTALDPAEAEQRIAALRGAGYTLVVEGAGGVLVPLAWRDGGFYTVLDLAERCALDAIIVARAGLGTLNHTALTVRALQSRGIAIRGVVLNGRDAAEETLAETTNRASLARMLPDIRLVDVPWQPPGATDRIDALVAPLID